jgi:hypothetical protein
MKLDELKDTPPWEWPEDAADSLLAVLQDDKAEEADRLLAVELSGDFSVIDEELSDALLAILKDPSANESLRGRAALSLGPLLEEVDLEGFDEPTEVPISEATFRRIQDVLHALYEAPSSSDEIRRAVLESSVRAPEDWHATAVRTAYATNEEAWQRTAVFCMRFVPGFGAEILEALESEDDTIHEQAILAAGTWQIDAAFSHVADLVSDADTPKDLLLAAIDAVASIRPHEAVDYLEDLADSDDEEISEAVEDAMATAEGLCEEDEEGDENEDDEEEEEDDEEADEDDADEPDEA